LLVQQSNPADPNQRSGADVSSASAAAAAGDADTVLPAAAGAAEWRREEAGTAGMISEPLSTAA